MRTQSYPMAQQSRFALRLVISKRSEVMKGHALTVRLISLKAMNHGLVK